MKRFAFTAAFISGLPALFYQVIWQRYLVLWTGLDAYAIAMVTVIFISGLAAGSGTGGYLADRSAPKHALKKFALCHLGIAVSVSLIPYVSVWMVQHLNGLSAQWLYTAFFWIPAFLMGMHLPLLAVGFKLPASDSSAVILYGFNTAGSLIGLAALSGLCLRPLGFEGSLYFSAMINLFIFFWGFVMRPKVTYEP